MSLIYWGDKKFEFEDVQIEDFTPYLLGKEKEFFKKGYQNECLCPLSIEEIGNTPTKTASISPYSRKETVLDKR